MTVKISFILGAIGNATSIALYASPIPTFCIIRRKKSTEMFSVLPYVSTLLTTFFGVFYGLTKEGGGMLIITVNTVGCIFEISYILMFVMYGSKAIRKKTAKLVLAETLFFGAVVCVSLFLTHGKTRLLTIGGISSAVGLTMYLAPLSVIRTVIRTKNVEPLPLTLSIFLLVNGSLWSAFAFFANDIFVGIPSFVGCIFSTGQIAIYAYCRMCSKHQQAAAATAAAAKNQTQDHQVIDVKEGEAKGEEARNSTTNGTGLKKQPSLNGSVIGRTASNRLVELLKDLPSNGITAYTTTSGKLFKEGSYHYVELIKQADD